MNAKSQLSRESAEADRRRASDWMPGVSACSLRSLSLSHLSVVRAPRPGELWQHSYVTPSLLSSILSAKYVNAVPLYRQEQAFAGSGIEISRQNMVNWIIKVSDLYLHKYYDVMHEKLQEQKYIHADETPVQVNKEKEPGNKKQYMWVYRTKPLMMARRLFFMIIALAAEQNTAVIFSAASAERLQRMAMKLTTNLHERTRHGSKLQDAGCTRGVNLWMQLKLTKTESHRRYWQKKAAARISRIFHENNKLGDLPAEERLRKRESGIRVSGKVSSRIRQREKLSAML